MSQAARDRPSRSGEATLARLGMPASTAVPALRTLGVWADGGPEPGAWAVIEALAASPNPERALPTLVDLAERHPDAWRELLATPEHVARVAAIGAASVTLGDVLVGSPQALHVLTDDLGPWDSATVRHFAREKTRGSDEPARSLASFQRRGLLRVAARDLLGYADTPTIAAELSELADGLIAAALDHVAEETLGVPTGEESGVTVIGMGKLGGWELNYVSDVDVLFVADGQWESATQVCNRLLRLLGEHTPVGRTYEMDVSLRPEGKDGSLVRTLDSYRAYYQRWADTWEFQALLKARPVAGDGTVGAEFMELVAPYVFPDRLESSAVAEIQRMKRVVEGSEAVVRAGSRQLKLAPGGLRDIEFSVQLLQLVHGRHDPTLRSGNTLEALSSLAEGGYVGRDDAASIRRAYELLRTVEHRLQLARLRRTHTLPTSDEERGRLARSLGFRDSADATALDQFDKEYRQVQAEVRRLHEKLFYRPLLERFAELSSADQMDLSGGLGEEPARERLAALGFVDAQSALGHLRALASGVSRRARLLRTLLPAILPTFAAAPDPDGGLAAFRELTERLERSPFFLRTLRDNPPVAELLAHVLGHSQLVGEWLQRQPEVIGHLAEPETLDRASTREDYRRQTEGLRRRGGSEAGAADGLRRLKRRELARIAVRDLSDRASVREVAGELTGLAEACLDTAAGLVVPEGVRLAVVAMGKLGGGELGYASDLDVLLVHEREEARDDALRAAARLLQVLGDITPEGQAFHVDVDLRPEGKDGPLARTLQSYRAYYERWGEAWELQALTQARPVAGDMELGRNFVDEVAGLVYPPDPPAERLQAVRQMKARVERERGEQGRMGGGEGRVGRTRRRGAGRAGGAVPTASSSTSPAVRVGDRVDVKFGPGGLTDVEWTVQLLQLRFGGSTAELRRPGTMGALDACEAEGFLEAEDAGWLREGYDLFSRLRNVLYLGGFRRTDVLPPGPVHQERLAGMLGYSPHGAQQLLEDLSRTMRRVRKVHERCFYDA